MQKLAVVTALLFLNSFAIAKDARPELNRLLNDFMAAASHQPPSAEDKAIFDRFFAEDVIYTRAAGVVITKADIMRSFDAPPASGPQGGSYTAEEVTIKQYGDMAVVAFRLVQHQADGTVNNYRNTGTFLRRNRHWQAVAWQATRVQAESKKP